MRPVAAHLESKASAAHIKRAPARVTARIPARSLKPAPVDPAAAILQRLRLAERLLVCSHARPDGDAVGSMLALGMLLEQMGKRTDLFSADPIPVLYRGLPGADAVRVEVCVREHYDAAILLECNAVERTGLRGLDELFFINIDHHITGKAFASLNWIDYQAASVGEMVHRLARAAGATLTPEMATCLYTTLLTDTGGFCSGAVKQSTFALAAELVGAGADPIAIAHNLYSSVSLAKLRLMGAALRRLKREGGVAWLWVTQEDMMRSCAAEEDSEGIVSIALSIAGVEAAVFLREVPDGLFRVSLRSRGQVNVAAIAARLGGGGHQNAAGCTLNGPLQRVREAILVELRTAVANLSAPDADRGRVSAQIC